MARKNKIAPRQPNNFLLAAIVIACAAAFYLPSLDYEYTGLDDTSLIVDNYSFLRDMANIPRAFGKGVFETEEFRRNRPGEKPRGDFYRPALTLSLMIDAQFAQPLPRGGVKPGAFRRGNIIMHAAATALLLFVMIRLGFRRWTSFALAMIFAAHPAFTQAVAWIPGRNDLLLAVFIFASFLALLVYIEKEKMGYNILHYIFFAIAMFTKESAILAAIVFLLYKILVNKKKWTALLPDIGIYILIFAVYFLARWSALAGAPEVDITAEGLPGTLLYILQYLQKAIIPVNLASVVTPRDTDYLMSAMAIIILVGGVLLSKSPRPRLMIFGALWFFIFIIPGLLPGIFSGMEHRLYLPFAGLAIFAGEFTIFRKIVEKKGIYAAAAAIIFIIFAFLTINRLPDYENRFSFWTAAVEDSEHSATACLNLGEMYQQVGKSARAAQVHREGLRRDEDMYMMNNNLGGAFMHMEQYDSARKYLHREIRFHPGNPFPFYNLGLMHHMLGRRDSAIHYYRKTLKIDRNFIYAKRQLKEIYGSGSR
jgi:tetratricopeptide (TPR) repeat protein